MMTAEVLDEPELEFAAGTRHIDVRFGLAHGGPLDVDDQQMRSISVGIVGSTETIERLTGWLDRCRGEIPGKESPYPNLFPGFPGFRRDTAFRSSLQIDTRMQRSAPARELTRLSKSPRSNALVEEAARMFLDEMQYISETSRPDVLLCAPPFELMQVLKDEVEIKDDTDEVEDEREYQELIRYDFHDMVKARAMSLRVPIQLLWPPTYDPTKRRKQKRRTEKPRSLQDEATRAWNLHTAIYYKAGGVPWRLIRDPSQLTSCCVGISFYKTLDGSRLMTSMAQVFNERGEGVVVRGGQVSVSKEDLQPHLTADDAEKLLANALATYRREHRTMPARIVVHKTSRFNDDEMEGCLRAAEASLVEDTDLLSLDSSRIRLYRMGEYAPLRGTYLSLDAVSQVLYTKGSVDFFQTHPASYVPLPLLFRCENTIQTPRFLAQEMLGLTKMNWNSTRFDGRDPITVRAAHQVGAMLRYVDEEGAVEPAYSFYM